MTKLNAPLTWSFGEARWARRCASRRARPFLALGATAVEIELNQSLATLEILEKSYEG
jgi:hypothetical protein